MSFQFVEQVSTSPIFIVSILNLGPGDWDPVWGQLIRYWRKITNLHLILSIIYISIVYELCKGVYIVCDLFTIDSEYNNRKVRTFTLFKERRGLSTFSSKCPLPLKDPVTRMGLHDVIKLLTFTPAISCHWKRSGLLGEWQGETHLGDHKRLCKGTHYYSPLPTLFTLPQSTPLACEVKDRIVSDLLLTSDPDPLEVLGVGSPSLVDSHEIDLIPQKCFLQTNLKTLTVTLWQRGRWNYQYFL